MAARILGYVGVGAVPGLGLFAWAVLAPDTLLLMRIGENPLIVKKLRFYAEKEFAGMFDAA